MATATYNQNSEPEQNKVLVYNEASQLMEWGPINKLIDKTHISIFEADSAQTSFTINTLIDSEERVVVYRNGTAVSFSATGYTVTLDSAADSGDEIRISHVPDSASHLGIMYWTRNRVGLKKYDSVNWGTLIDLVDSTPDNLGIAYYNAADSTNRMSWGTLVDLVDSTPAHQDIPMYDSDTRRMSWGRAPTMASAIFAIDVSDVNTTPPAGSYVSGYGTVSGGGLSETGIPMAEGTIYGPTDGTEITVSGSPGDYFLVTQPV
jgi:hypothetical protein